MLAGCKKENDTKGVTLKASIEQNKGNGRTSLNPADGAISWTAGDKIVVNNGSSSATFTLTGGAGSTEGTFVYGGEYEFGTDNVAVYPQTAAIGGNTVSFILPEEQTAAAGTFGNGANPMLGTFSDPDALTFTSLCGGLGISLTGDNVAITSIEIVSNNTNDKLNGAFEADCTAANPVLTATTGNTGTHKVTLNCATTLTADPQEFFIVLPVGTLAEGFTLNVYDGGEEPILSKTTESTALTVELNTVKTMNTVEVSNASPEPPAGPQGIIDGAFTINANGDQVYFSQGNLQYRATTNTWQFAEHQYDYVGNANSAISQTNSGWIDLFGWGTSGYNHGAVCYQPWNTSTSYSDYYVYGNWQYSLYDGNGQADWGYNAISNGGNAENSGWRTLTQPEWNYVIYTRSTTCGIRFAKATVNGVSGLILLPDNWDASVYALSNTNVAWGGFDNTITAEDWANTLEANGAVFLPAAGNRWGISVDFVGSHGNYWSASYYDSYRAWRVYFSGGYLSTNYYSRGYGFSVRLVRSCQ